MVLDSDRPVLMRPMAPPNTWSVRARRQRETVRSDNGGRPALNDDTGDDIAVVGGGSGGASGCSTMVEDGDDDGGSCAHTSAAPPSTRITHRARIDSSYRESARWRRRWRLLT